MMMKRVSLGLAVALIATTFGFSATFAQSNQAPPPDATTPHQVPRPDRSMMGGSGMMMGQMTRMMENCNRMMESTQHSPSAPDTTQPHNG